MGFGNAAPVIDGVSASPSPVPAGATATLTCAAHDSDGTVQSIAIEVSGGTLPNGTAQQALSITTGASASGAIPWSTPAPGSYTVTCTAVDDGGLFGTPPATASASITVSVVTASAVVVDAFTGPTAPLMAGAQARFQVAAHDPAGGALTYAWSASAGTVQAEGASATFTAPDAGGTVSVTVTVADEAGATASATLAVTVVVQPYQGGLPAAITGPRRLAAAGSRLYAVDGAGALWILSARGEVIATPALPEPALAVAAAPDAVFVSTAGGRVLRLDPASGKVAGAVDLGLSTGPAGLAYEPSRGLVWMAERDAGQVRAIRRDGTAALVLRSAGGAPLVNPGDVAVDASAGLVWVLLEGGYGGPLAHAFTVDGAYVRSAFDPAAGPRVERPGGLAVDGQGRLYVSDFYGGTVQVLSAGGASAGPLGAFGDGPGLLRQPAGIAALASGDVVVASMDSGRLERFGTTPDLPSCPGDSDCDGMPDAWEIAHGLNPHWAGDALLDLDGDGLTNLQEFLLGTDPRKRDTDGDGYSDGEEVATGFNPLDPSDHGPMFTASSPAEGGPGLVRISSSGSASCAVAWRQVSGPPVALRGASTFTPSFIARKAATYALEGVARCGAATPPPVRVAAVIRNAAPRADAGRTAVVRAGRFAALDGSASSDANGDALSLRWEQTLGPAVSGGSRGGFLALEAERPAVLAFELTATDGAGAAGKGDVTVVVVGEEGAPAAAAPSPLTGRVGEAVTLQGGATPARHAALAWAQVEGPRVALSGAAEGQASFVPPAPGRYAFELSASERGRPSPPARVEVYVASAGGALPTASARAPATAAVGDAVELDGSASSGAASHRWRQLSGPAAGLRDEDRAVASAALFAPGSYVFELAVEGAAGPGVPARVRIDAAQPGRALPVAVAIASRHGGGRLRLDGRASRGAGPLRFRWTQVAGPWVALDEASSAAPSFEPPADGTYAFELEVDDGSARSAPARVELAAARGEERDDR